jgi:ankyrin repeat protein
LSTFEGVLDYILREHADLSRVSTKNLCFWLAIQTGDIDQVRKYSHDYAHDTLDTNGNNALMIACIHGQAEIAAYLLQSPDQGSRNDQNSTPLICAIQSNSLDTVRVLLQDTNIRQTVNTVFDNAGNSAALYACSTNNIDLVKVLVERGGAQLDLAVSTTTRDSALHVAAGSDASLPFLLYIFHHTTNALHRRNSHGETVYHVCKNVDFAKYLLNQVVSAKQTMIKSIDTFGRSPIMTWAAKGRLDLVELLISDLNTEDCARVDRQGRTLLHLLASHLTKGLTYGGNSLDFIVSKLRSIIHVREWSHGSTALHLAAETSTLASMQSVNGAIEFIRTLVKYGAELDAVNDRDEHPINISRIPEIISCLDGNCYTVQRFLSVSNTFPSRAILACSYEQISLVSHSPLDRIHFAKF